MSANESSERWESHSNLDPLGQPRMDEIMEMEREMMPNGPLIGEAIHTLKGHSPGNLSQLSQREMDQFHQKGIDPTRLKFKADGGIEIVAPPKDNINHPAHYMVGGVETWDYLKMKLSKEELRGHCKACILKYISRASYKGSEKDDVSKAAWYAMRLQESFNDAN